MNLPPIVQQFIADTQRYEQGVDRVIAAAQRAARGMAAAMASPTVMVQGAQWAASGLYAAAQFSASLVKGVTLGVGGALANAVLSPAAQAAITARFGQVGQAVGAVFTKAIGNPMAAAAKFVQDTIAASPTVQGARNLVRGAVAGFRMNKNDSFDRRLRRDIGLRTSYLQKAIQTRQTMLSSRGPSRGFLFKYLDNTGKEHAERFMGRNVKEATRSYRRSMARRGIAPFTIGVDDPMQKRVTEMFSRLSKAVNPTVMQGFGEAMGIAARHAGAFAVATAPFLARGGYRIGAFAVNNRLTRFGASAGAVGVRLAGRGIARAARGGRSLFNKVVGGTLNRVKGLASFGAKASLFAIPAAMSVIGVTAVKLAAELEQTKVAFTAMTGSGEVAAKMLTDINKIAVQSPFTIREMRVQAKQLLAFGLESKEVVPVLRMLGDVSAATGTSMERIILAYGQVRAQGRLMGPELRQFTDAGIPILDYLAQVKNRPKIAIRGMVTEGQVSDADTHEAFMRMTAKGGVFYNYMAKMAMTVKGQFSNLVDYVQVALERLGTAFNNGFGVSELLDRVAESIRGVSSMDMSKLEGFFGRMREVFDVVLLAAEALYNVLSKQIGSALDENGLKWTDWKGIAVAVIKGMVGMIGLLIDTIKNLAVQIAVVMESLGQALTNFGLTDQPTDFYSGARKAGHSKAVSGLGAIGNAVLPLVSPFGTGDMLSKWGEMSMTGGVAKNPLAGIADKLRAAVGPAGSFGATASALLAELDKLIKADGAKSVIPKADREARRLAEVDEKIARMREEFAVQAMQKGIAQQSIELAGKTYGDMMHGKGGPWGVFQSQMRRFDEIRNYREAKTGMRFFGDDTDRVVDFGQVAAFKQMAAEVGKREYQPLAGAGLGSKEEAMIVARSQAQSVDMLTEIRNTMMQAMEIQKRQAEYDAAVAQVLQETFGDGGGIVGGRVN